MAMDCAIGANLRCFWGLGLESGDHPANHLFGQTTCLTSTLPKLKYLSHRSKFPSEKFEVENGFTERESDALELEIHPAFEVFPPKEGLSDL